VTQEYDPSYKITDSAGVTVGTLILRTNLRRLVGTHKKSF